MYFILFLLWNVLNNQCDTDGLLYGAPYSVSWNSGSYRAVVRKKAAQYVIIIYQ